MPQLESKVETICADAFAYVLQSERKFDLVCMDVFLDVVVPENFEQTIFLENLKKLVSKNGILLFNRISQRSQDRQATETFFKEKFKPVFPEASYLEIGGNWMY